MKRGWRMLWAGGLWVSMAMSLCGQERQLSRCPHLVCPQLIPKAPLAPLIACTGSELVVCADLEQIPGCYGEENFEYIVGEQNWKWSVEGFDAKPPSGRGSCAVFTNVGVGYGRVEFTVWGARKMGEAPCRDRKTVATPVHSHRLVLWLEPPNYLPLDGFDPPDHQEHSMLVVARLNPERSDYAYEWSLSGTCVFGPAGSEKNSRVILDTDQPSGTYRGERVQVAKVCTEAQLFTVVQVDVDGGLCESQEEQVGLMVAANNNDSDGSGVADYYEQPVGTEDPDLVPIRVTIEPPNLPASEVVSIFGGGLYEDRYKRQVAKSAYSVGELPKTLYLEGRTPSDRPRDRTISVVHAASGARDRLKYTVVKVDMAVDGNRDGVIAFDNPEDAQCLFWVNDDYDVKHWNERMWQQDDGDPAEHRDCDDNYIGNIEKSSSGACERDLEDFARLHIRVDNNLATMPGITYYLVFEHISSGSPSVNIFEAVDTSSKYLSEPMVAAQQIGMQNLTLNGVAASEVALDPFFIKTGNQVSPFLIEGRSVGKGSLTLIVKKDGKPLCRKAVSLELHQMPWFYDVYTVSVTSGVRWEVQIPTTAVHSQTASYRPATDEKFLMVHGWNMNDKEKKAWIETVFKRLWWQGYRGAVALFDWPTLSDMNFWDVLAGAHHFDNSEFRAWLSADALVGVFNALNKDGTLRVLAHSMGNVVVGEALRRYAGVKLHTYIACQAALSAHYFDNTVAVDHPCEQKIFDPWFPNTPDIMGYFATGDTNSYPYLLRNKANVSNMRNYYNDVDWALQWWELNNVLKPDGLTPYLFGYRGSTDRYREGLDQFARGATVDPYEVLSVADARQRYMIFSYCAESRSRALGQAESSMFAGWHLRLPTQQGGMGYDWQHYSHSRQFRSTIADEWPFWSRVFKDCEFENRKGETSQ